MKLHLSYNLELRVRPVTIREGNWEYETKEGFLRLGTDVRGSILMLKVRGLTAGPARIRVRSKSFYESAQNKDKVTEIGQISPCRREDRNIWYSQHFLIRSGVLDHNEMDYRHVSIIFDAVQEKTPGVNPDGGFSIYDDYEIDDVVLIACYLSKENYESDRR